MPQITITVQNKPYTLSCPAGNESHVYRLAEKVNTYMDNLVKHGAILSNQGLLIFALLGMAEKIESLEDKIDALQTQIEDSALVASPLLVAEALSAEPLAAPVVEAAPVAQAAAPAASQTPESVVATAAPAPAVAQAAAHHGHTPSATEIAMVAAAVAVPTAVAASVVASSVASAAFSDDENSLSMEEALSLAQNISHTISEQTIEIVEDALSALDLPVAAPAAAIAHPAPESVSAVEVIAPAAVQEIASSEFAPIAAVEAPVQAIPVAEIAPAVSEEVAVAVVAQDAPLQTDAEKAAQAFLAAATLSLEQWESTVSDPSSAENLQNLKKRAEALQPFSSLAAQLEAEMDSAEEEAKEEMATQKVDISEDLELAEDSNRLLSDVLERIASLAKKLENAD